MKSIMMTMKKSMKKSMRSDSPSTGRHAHMIRKLSILAAVVCLTLTACKEPEQEPVRPVDIVEPIMLETTEAESTEVETAETAEKETAETESTKAEESEAESTKAEESEAEPTNAETTEAESTETETETGKEGQKESAPAGVTVRVDGIYTSAADVAAYIHEYGRLPGNFITKKQAEKLGWEGGSLKPYAPDKCIGGDYFGNYEGLLPEKDGREYRECDIDTLGKDKRGKKRIIYSNDGLIYYTSDHYASFKLLYGEE